MLISILVVTLFLGGGNTYLTSSGKDLDKSVAAVIEDKEQRKEIQDALEESRELLKYYNSRLLTVIQNGQTINSEYNSEIEDFNIWMDIVYTEREEYMEKLEEIHFKLADSMTKEQWDMIIDPIVNE